MLYCVYLSEGRLAAWQDVQDEIYDRVADKVSAVRSVFKEQCAGGGGRDTRRCWQTLAQQKVSASVYEMRNLAKSKSIQAGCLACCNVVNFLRCIAVFHTAPPPTHRISFPHFFHSFAVFAHEETKNANLEAETETGSRKYSIQSANKQPTISHHLLPGLRTASSASLDSGLDSDCNCSSEMRNSLFI